MCYCYIWAGAAQPPLSTLDRVQNRFHAFAGKDFPPYRQYPLNETFLASRYTITTFMAHVPTVLIL